MGIRGSTRPPRWWEQLVAFGVLLLIAAAAGHGFSIFVKVMLTGTP